MVCGKVRLTEAEAIEWVRQQTIDRLNNNKKAGRTIRTYYYCKACEAYHVSSDYSTMPRLKSKYLK